MKQITKLDITSFIEYCENLKLEKETLFHSSLNYFNGRIQTQKLLTKEEIEQIPKMTFLIKEIFSTEEKKRNHILLQVRNLLLLSKDRINYTNVYEQVKELEKKDQKQLNGNDFFDYVCLLLDHAMCCIAEAPFEGQLKSYLKQEPSLDVKTKIMKLLASYSYDEWMEEEKFRMEQVIQKLSNPSEFLFFEYKMKEELKKKLVCAKALEEYLTKLELVVLKGINEEEFQALNRLLEQFQNDQYLRIRMDHVANYRNISNRLEQLYETALASQSQEQKLKEKIKTGEITLSNGIPKQILSEIQIDFDDLEYATEPRIITIDSVTTPDKDGAFSIQKIDNIYMLNVYITDVPTFLRNNPKICRFAYQTGNSLYIRNYQENLKYHNIDMIPSFLSHKYLSLHQGYPTNTIAFNFIFGPNGELYSRSISRKRIKVTHALTPKQVKQILNSKDYLGSIQDDLKDYQELCIKVRKDSKDKFLQALNLNSIDDLVAFPSILVNYYLAKETQSIIYREHGKYVKNYQEESYTHSATPLRRFVSDINLAFFLNQIGVVSFPEKELNYVEKNIEEIIAHLNERESLQKLIDTNASFVKKYIKK